MTEHADYGLWLKSLCVKGHTLVRCAVGLYRCQNCRYELCFIDGRNDG